MFYWGLVLFWVMGVGFQNICTFSGKWMSPGLFQDCTNVKVGEFPNIKLSIV